MRMDWAWAGITFTWVAGLAIVLAVLSYASYRAEIEHLSLWHVLRRNRTLQVAAIGAWIFLIGVWLTGAPLEQKLVWSAGVAWLTIETGLVWRRKPQ